MMQNNGIHGEHGHNHDDHNPNGLQSIYEWNLDRDAPTLNYNFWESRPSYYNAGDREGLGFERFSPVMQQATQTILKNIESFTNIRFIETHNESETHIGFGQAAMGNNVGALAYYPGGTDKSGDVWTNTQYFNDSRMEQGKYGYFVLMHEIGHAMGLKHTFDAGFDAEHDSERFSVMSYDWSAWGHVYAQSFQMDDIHALQDLYGVNYDHNAGNTIYDLSFGDAYTIWDGGGNDTLNAEHIDSYTIINLNEGAFSSIGLERNIGVAYGVTIENANGGSADDIIHANEVNNTLNGNNGNDTFHGSGGNDIIDGGMGEDIVIYDGERSQFEIFREGGKTIVTDQTALYGIDVLNDVETIQFNDGIVTVGDIINAARNIQQGDDSNNKLYGDGQNDILYGLSGRDNLISRGGDDRLHGGDDSDRLDAGAGNDILHGDGGNDQMFGRGGDDILYGGEGRDTLYGNDGQDILNGGDGRDFLYGGRDSDLFVFDSLDGSVDRVQDFTLNGDEKDSLNIADILSGYDANDSIISEFVKFTHRTGGRVSMHINSDGQGDDWNHVADIQGSDVSGITAEYLVSTDQLILDFSAI